MTHPEARIRQRLRPLLVTVFVGEMPMLETDSAVKWKRDGDGVRVWTYEDGTVEETWFPHVDEVRVEW